MTDIRLAVVGLGNMGSLHAASLRDGLIPGARLTAVGDVDASRLDAFPEAARFTDAGSLVMSGVADAVVVATPHLDHAPVGAAALDAGMHVLVEKPLTVHVAQARDLLAAHARHPDLVLAFMANQRTDPRYRLLKQLLDDRELGDVHRVCWTITDWFRTDAYYNSGSWRATWSGEGGGVLVNQCPHQFDLLCWLFGSPIRVRGHCQLGRWHDLEVEDACTAYFEYANGATGVFITSTGEAPGTNRLEVATDRGRIVIDEGFEWLKTTPSVSEQLRQATGPFDEPEIEEITYEFEGWGGQHREILTNFVDSIDHGAPLIGPGADGMAAVQLANAILISSMWDRTVDLPLDEVAVQAEFDRLAASSQPRTTATGVGIVNLSGSFGNR